MLQYASYLCIDQFNNNQERKYVSDEEKLRWLSNRVRGLPANLEEINPSKDQKVQLSASNHRSFTHMGWNYPYASHAPGDIANSKVRMDILKKTVQKVFGFNLSNGYPGKALFNSVFGKDGEDDKHDAFCRLIYYIHILGDCFEDENYKQANGNNNGKKIPLGREHPGNTIEDTDLISELIKSINDLFINEKNDSFTYMPMIDKLNEKRDEIHSLYSKWGEINSPERYDEYHLLTNQVMIILKDDLPNLLFQESFFHDVFY